MKLRARLFGLAAAAAVFALALPATAAETGWDQAKVTTLAGELAAAAQDLRDAVRQAGPPQAGSMQSRDYQQFKDGLRLIRSESRHLASELAEGRGLEETLPVYRRLRLLIRDARELARRLYLQQPIQDRIASGRSTLDALAVYYPAED